jgi:hypothetical protein
VISNCVISQYGIGLYPRKHIACGFKEQGIGELVTRLIPVYQSFIVFNDTPTMVTSSILVLIPETISMIMI